MPRHSLHFKRRVYKLLNLRVGIIKLSQLCHLVHILIRHSEGAPHIAYCGSCRHGSEGDYLRHMILAVLSVDIFYDLLAAFVAEVNIKVRH